MNIRTITVNVPLMFGVLVVLVSGAAKAEVDCHTFNVIDYERALLAGGVSARNVHDFASEQLGVCQGQLALEKQQRELNPHLASQERLDNDDIKRALGKLYETVTPWQDPLNTTWARMPGIIAEIKQSAGWLFQPEYLVELSQLSGSEHPGPGDVVALGNDMANIHAVILMALIHQTDSGKFTTYLNLSFKVGEAERSLLDIAQKMTAAYGTLAGDVFKIAYPNGNNGGQK